MKNIPRIISGLIGQFFSPKKLFSFSAPPFFPFYHVVSKQNLEHIYNYPYRRVTAFEKELDFILKFFEPVSLDYILKNPKSGKKVFHLSFDDGLKECHEIIAPILLRKGIPATFFVNTGFVDNKALFHKYKASLLMNKLNQNTKPEIQKVLEAHNFAGRNILSATILHEPILDELAEKSGVSFSEFLKKEKPYLSTQQILELQEQGFTIGSHSVSHPEFWLISEEAQYKQIKDSMNWLNKNVKPEIKTFAFPYSDWGSSGRVLKQIKNENICDITFGTAGVKYDEYDFHFQRYPMENRGDFVNQLKSEFVYFYLRKQTGHAIVKH